MITLSIVEKINHFGHVTGYPRLPGIGLNWTFCYGQISFLVLDATLLLGALSCSVAIAGIMLGIPGDLAGGMVL